MTTALEAVNRAPQLNWMSSTARALLAVALADGEPLRVITVVDDAVVLVCTEHLIRCEELPFRDALARARTENIDDVTLRGIVRFAAALGDDTPELDALLMEHGCRDVRSLTREQAVRIAIELFARPEAPRGITWEQLVDASPRDDVAPRVLDDVDDGDLVGRCNECSGAVYAGVLTIAIGWPQTKPVWELITPSVARTESVQKKLVDTAELIAAGGVGDDTYAKLQQKYAAALTTPPRAGTKLSRLLAGELQMLCSPCTMAMKHGGREVLPPSGAIETIAPDPPVFEAAGSLLRDAEPEGQPGACGVLTVPGVGPEVAGGLIDRAVAIAAAVKSIDVDHRRVAQMMSAVEFAGDDAELRYLILALAWQLERPLRIKTVPEDAVRLDSLVDLALRGGGVDRALERAA